MFLVLLAVILLVLTREPTSCLSRVAAAERETSRRDASALGSVDDPPRIEPFATGLEREITNSLGMKLRLVPAGEFTMGSPKTELGALEEHDEDEVQRRVKLAGSFYLGVYEVTQGEYQKVMDANPSRFSASGRGRDDVAGRNTDRFPVERVNWADAVEFCRRLSKQENKRYRLPTTAEWEYACRAGTNTRFSFGDVCDESHANCAVAIPESDEFKWLGRTTEVGQYAPNRFGFYDMHGNVREWCADEYTEIYDPVADDKRLAKLEPGEYRQQRGGSWADDPRLCRSAFTFPGKAKRLSYYVGFRVVCEP